MGGRPGTIFLAERKRASPMPPRTACEMAPANPAMRFTVTTEPRTPNRMLERMPARSAFLTKGIAGVEKRRKKIHRVPLFPVPLAAAGFVGQIRIVQDLEDSASVEARGNVFDRARSVAHHVLLVFVPLAYAKDNVGEGRNEGRVVGGDEYGGRTFQVPEDGEEPLLARPVHVRRGFVQDEEPRRARQRPRDKDAAPLPARERRVGALFQVGDAGQLERRVEVGAGGTHAAPAEALEPSHPHHFLDRYRKSLVEVHVLGHVAYVAPGLLGILPENFDFAGLRPGETHDEPQDRRLARTVRPHEGDKLAFMDMERTVFQHLDFAMGETDAGEFDSNLL